MKSTDSTQRFIRIVWHVIGVSFLPECILQNVDLIFHCAFVNEETAEYDVYTISYTCRTGINRSRLLYEVRVHVIVDDGEKTRRVLAAATRNNFDVCHPDAPMRNLTQYELLHARTIRLALSFHRRHRMHSIKATAEKQTICRSRSCTVSEETLSVSVSGDVWKIRQPDYVSSVNVRFPRLVCVRVTCISMYILPVNLSRNRKLNSK